MRSAHMCNNFAPLVPQSAMELKHQHSSMVLTMATKALLFQLPNLSVRQPMTKSLWSNWLVNSVTRTSNVPLVKPLPTLVIPIPDKPSMHMARDDIRASPMNLARPATTVIEMPNSKMIAGNYIQNRRQTGAPSVRTRVVLCLHMVLPNMNATFSKALLHCAAGSFCLCLTALCCGAILSLLVCAVMLSHSVFTRLYCDVGYITFLCLLSSCHER